MGTVGIVEFDGIADAGVSRPRNRNIYRTYRDQSFLKMLPIVVIWEEL
jgi:hypothetical protein